MPNVSNIDRTERLSLRQLPSTLSRPTVQARRPPRILMSTMPNLRLP